MNDTKIIIIMIIGTILFFMFLGFVANFTGKNITCPRFAENIERPYRYSFWGGGCFVQDMNGRWVQKDNYWNSPK